MFRTIWQQIIKVLFREAVRRMVGAFERRVRDLYGAPAQGSAGRAAV